MKTQIQIEGLWLNVPLSLMDRWELFWLRRRAEMRKEMADDEFVEVFMVLSATNAGRVFMCLVSLTSLTLLSWALLK